VSVALLVAILRTARRRKTILERIRLDPELSLFCAYWEGMEKGAFDKPQLHEEARGASKVRAAQNAGRRCARKHVTRT